MNNIIGYTSPNKGSLLVHDSVGAIAQSSMSTTDGNTGGVTSTTGMAATSSVSILARQLSEAATRAETLDAGFRKGNHASQVFDPLDQIAGDKYVAGKVQHDSELPATSDLELLARAKQATGYVNGSDSNPFKGLARDQLMLIAYDEGGPFTINERRAAWEESRASNLPNERAHAVSSIAPVGLVASGAGMGRDLMISRIFGSREPMVASASMAFGNSGQSPYDFLTLGDRALLSEMYAYAQAEEADLTYVDRLAFAIGFYRNYDNGNRLSNFNDGNNYDLEGHQLTVSFNDKDTATASRILSGSAISSTRFDSGFLHHFLDPGYGALSYVGGLEFLEKMVTKFSDEGTTQRSLGRQFSTFERVTNVNDTRVITASKEVLLAPFKPVATSVNGVWTLTEHGLSAGATSAPETVGTRGLSSDFVGPMPNRYILDALLGTSDRAELRPSMPGGLFKWLRNH